MGCCPSKPNTNQVEVAIADGVQEMLMDRGDGTMMDKSDDEAEDDEDKISTVPMALEEELARSPEPVSPPPSPRRKSSHSADEMPISSTYHRMQMHEMEVQEAERQEELRQEAEQREREVREFKVAMQNA
ncbi:hypothetical protein PHMEG_0002865 [Phytophthora megakarya]|uniref:Uncharacterized protein n=1 Tax=Phytophthora megakarya TaxID=4795 RepID=A0A225WZG4_9STRA|nr:hypothetical protein PHMEG_0002865 [Phytophthora megakarya]